MQVYLEDDSAEWASYLGEGSEDVLGFVLFQPAPSPLYHAILIGPTPQAALRSWLSSGSPSGNEYNFAVAAMTLVHESFHWRLMSGDESTVNACALSYLPYYLSKDMGVPATTTQTTTTRVPTTTVVTKQQRVKVKGKWTTRTTRTKVTTYVSHQVTTTVPNPLYTTIVADAHAFYSSQPPPYNAGACPTAPPTSSPAPTPTPAPTPAPTPNYHVKACWTQYTGNSLSAVSQSAATTQYSAADILARGASNFWMIVQLDQAPSTPFDGTTITLYEPNGTKFTSSSLSPTWPTTTVGWRYDFDWTWSDKTLFFQRPATTGSGTWTIRWTFPDGEVCSSAFTVGA